MLSFPNCKINLGLNILHKREDGFHDIATIFYPVQLFDALEVIPISNNTVEFTQTGLLIDGKEEDNLCIKAWHLLKKDFSQLPGVKMHLQKNIPMGAGLGGGSADGAFALKLLNEKFRLDLPTPRLIEYAASLGSDGPFFIINKPCFATGRGEMLEEINIDLSAYTIVLINPGIHVNTGWAFAQVPGDLQLPDSYRSLKEIIQQPIASWKDELQNDFEKPIFEKYPGIKKIKEELYAKGAIYASMSGSGSTVFGVFEKKITINSFSHYNYLIKIV
jgi:4-diphosphocytidyl-2-C-methyl-D-erythritol kinase